MHADQEFQTQIQQILESFSEEAPPEDSFHYAEPDLYTNDEPVDSKPLVPKNGLTFITQSIIGLGMLIVMIYDLKRFSNIKIAFQGFGTYSSLDIWINLRMDIKI